MQLKHKMSFMVWREYSIDETIVFVTKLEIWLQGNNNPDQMWSSLIPARPYPFQDGHLESRHVPSELNILSEPNWNTHTCERAKKLLIFLNGYYWSGEGEREIGRERGKINWVHTHTDTHTKASGMKVRRISLSLSLYFYLPLSLLLSLLNVKLSFLDSSPLHTKELQ